MTQTTVDEAEANPLCHRLLQALSHVVQVMGMVVRIKGLRRLLVRHRSLGLAVYWAPLSTIVRISRRPSVIGYGGKCDLH